MIVRKVATDAMKDVRICTACAHLLMVPREASKRFNYVCGLSGLIASQERAIGNCGRFGVLWADQTPVVVSTALDVVGSLPKNVTPSPVAVEAVNAASGAATVISQVREDAQKVQEQRGADVPIVVIGQAGSI